MPESPPHQRSPENREPPGRPGRQTVWDRAFAPVDIGFLVYFRMVLGFLFLGNILFYYQLDGVRIRYVVPHFHFKYYGFEWVHSWPGIGIHCHFVALGVLSVCLAIGFWYRISSFLFALGLTHFFLIDKAYFQNHYYLLCILAWMMVLLPAQRAFSVDALLRPKIRSATVPAWTLWWLRLQLGVPYFFGGIAKLNHDWLAGEPMRSILSYRTSYPLIGRFFTEEWCVQLFAQGGLWFDLLIVPALLWRRTRVVAYLAAVLFHLMNQTLFLIGVFPWFMIFATAVFFRPDWLRRLFRQPRAAVVTRKRTLTWTSLSRSTKNGTLLLGAWIAFQVIWPLRPLAYAGDPSWTEQGHYFAWRMMLREKTSLLRFHVTHPKTGMRGSIDPRDDIIPFQFRMMSNDASMIQEYCHYLADKFRQKGYGEVEIRALALTSLNGRKAQLFIDPNVDLAAQPRTIGRPPWIIPLTEPLRAQRWDIPINQWVKHLDLPPLPTMNKPVSATDARSPAPVSQSEPPINQEK
jgi:vitamin K-dependent gamma-carboxylase